MELIETRIDLSNTFDNNDNGNNDTINGRKANIKQSKL